MTILITVIVKRGKVKRSANLALSTYLYKFLNTLGKAHHSNDKLLYLVDELLKNDKKLHIVTLFNISGFFLDYGSTIRNEDIINQGLEILERNFKSFEE